MDLFQFVSTILMLAFGLLCVFNRDWLWEHIYSRANPNRSELWEYSMFFFGVVLVFFHSPACWEKF
jgi:hypothetical protein